MPEEEGWVMQRAITVLILCCFEWIEGVTKSRLSSQTLQRLPPLIYAKGDPTSYKSRRMSPRTCLVGWHWSWKHQRIPPGLQSCLFWEGSNTTHTVNWTDFFFFTYHTKKCCALLEAAFSSFNQCNALFFFFSFLLNQYWATEISRVDSGSRYSSTMDLESFPWGEPESWWQMHSCSIKPSPHHSCSALHIL